MAKKTKGKPNPRKKQRLNSEAVSMVLQDIQASQRLTTLVAAYLPWSGFSIRPSGLEKVLNEILFHRCGCIVECGGGLSTIYIAALLRQQQHGHLFTVEHNLEWLELLRGWLQAQGLQDYVTLIAAPLTDCNLALHQTQWYDTKVIQGVLDRYGVDHSPSGAESPRPIAIDLLLVDGPPAYEEGKELSRYPAVPFFKSWFADRVVVILDDFQRPGEQKILKRWEALLNFKFQGYELDGGLAIGKAKTAFSNSTRVT
jgi:Methyltransferase domain